jgi:pimeloyl-ACP methyl ester carboxylesterase
MLRRITIGVGLAALASCGSAVPRRSPDARTAAIRTVHVPWGRIGYRSVGRGPALVLLIGGGGISAPSIDDWAPSLLDGLAKTHRLLAMDYEGIGRTSLRPGPLTIDRLADDTADFIHALHLHRPDVMGWSMGGFVAQALAIRHPRLVHRLVLCSTALGDGTARPARVTVEERYPWEWLFPLDAQNQARASAYERVVRSYPHYYEGSHRVANAEGVAGYLWVHGYVKDGHDAARITAHALVGDGSQDVLLPLPDSRNLARTIPNATLTLYPDSGHGFLVQHQADWLHRVEQFLG